MPRVFLITGTSTGFGREYVQEVVNNGDYVIATARKPETLSFENSSEDNFLAIPLDVTDKSSIELAFKKGIAKFGRIDVVVNNAGYGLAGFFEELSEEQLRQQMEVNFFGLLDVTRIAMSTFRDQSPSGGLIQQITSIGGQKGNPGLSVYCASKWAVEGFTEAVSQEVKAAWGIKFTCIEPGGFRTDWSGRSMEFGERHPAYDHADVQAIIKHRNGTQIGDPVKAAKAMYSLALLPNPPLRVVLGSDAYTAIMGKIDSYSENYKLHEDLSKSTDMAKL